MKETDMLEWMNELDSRFLTEAEKPLPQKHVRPRRYITAAIAAAAAVICLTISTAAYAARNTDILNRFFGESGTDFAMQHTLPEPVSYTNGSYTVTVETALNDGYNQMLLLSFRDMNGNDVPKPEECRLQIWKNGELAASNLDGFGYDANGIHFCYWQLYFSCKEFAEGETAVLTFPKWGFAEEKENPLEGIEIPITVQQNTDSAQFVSMNGDSITLSNFELIHDYDSTGETNAEGMPAYEQSMMSNADLFLLMHDGTRHRMYPASSGARPINPESTVWREHCDVYTEKIPGEWDDIDFRGWSSDHHPLEDPTEYLGYLDIRAAEALEVNGVIYEKT